MQTGPSPSGDARGPRSPSCHPTTCAEHVELGYATTAHRAQGRTVDTAHAYLSAATVRESLYVMATRGRETNRLYVDTTYDPDASTGHEPPTVADPLNVLAAAIITTGADVSATEAQTREAESVLGPRRLAAESAAVTARRRGGPTVY